jgi:hypothetical protein
VSSLIRFGSPTLGGSEILAVRQLLDRTFPHYIKN